MKRKRWIGAAVVMAMLCLASCQPAGDGGFMEGVDRMRGFGEDFSIEEVLSDASEGLVSLEMAIERTGDNEYDALVSFDGYAIGRHTRIDDGSLRVSLATDGSGNAIRYSIGVVVDDLLSVSYFEEGSNMVSGDEMWHEDGIRAFTVEEGDIQGVRITENGSGYRLETDDTLSAICPDGMIFRRGYGATANIAIRFPEWLKGTYEGTISVPDPAVAIDIECMLKFSASGMSLTAMDPSDGSAIEMIPEDEGIGISTGIGTDADGSRTCTFTLDYDTLPVPGNVGFSVKETDGGILVSIPAAGASSPEIMFSRVEK